MSSSANLLFTALVACIASVTCMPSSGPVLTGFPERTCNTTTPMHLERLFINGVQTSPVGSLDTGVPFASCGCATVSGFRAVASGAGLAATTGPTLVTMDHNAATWNWAIRWDLSLTPAGEIGTYLAVDIAFVSASLCIANPSISNNAWLPPGSVARTHAPTQSPTTPAPTASPTM